MQRLAGGFTWSAGRCILIGLYLNPADFALKVFPGGQADGALAHHSDWTLENLTRMNKKRDGADCEYEAAIAGVRSTEQSMFMNFMKE